jgi:hypothetical protein
MMTGLVLGVAILVSSSGLPRVIDTPRPAIVPTTFTFRLPDDALTSRKLPARFQAAQPPKRYTKTDKVIAIAAGAVGGFLTGGYIGGLITENRDNPDDDTSVLKGIVIGAPIGAVIGAFIGHKLTK